MKVINIIILVLILAVNSYSSQFGLKMGMTINEIDKKAKHLSGNKYLVNAPNPHKAFKKRCMVAISPTSGLYQIMAMSEYLKTNRFGTGIKTSFYNMENKLSKVYGKSEVTDKLLSGSLWKKAEYWTMGLLKGDRRLAAIWKNYSYV